MGLCWGGGVGRGGTSWGGLYPQRQGIVGWDLRIRKGRGELGFGRCAGYLVCIVMIDREGSTCLL